MLSQIQVGQFFKIQSNSIQYLHLYMHLCRHTMQYLEKNIAKLATYKLQLKQYIPKNSKNMGLFNSKQKLALLQAKKVKDDLYKRVEIRLAEFQKLIQKIPQEKKLQVYNSDASGIVQMLDKGLLTCEQVTLICIQRTGTVGVQNNYVLDQLFSEGFKKAQKFDQIRKENKEKKSWKPGMNKKDCLPPFFGVPISIKQTILIKGRQSYAGFATKINQIPQINSLIVQQVKKMGFIIISRGNVPQGLKTVQTNNNMFGYCKNSWNPQRSAGGSSGGEGGLVGTNCLPIGLGSDIGGSLRIPAQWNGLFTLKANGRITKTGNAYYGKMAGGSPVKGQPGFIAKSVEDLKVTLSFLCDSSNYENILPEQIDPYQNLIPFDHSIFQKTLHLKIGYLTHLETLNCSSTHERVVQETVSIFKNMGHLTQKVTLPGFQDLYSFLLRLNMGCQDMNVFKQLKGNEPLIKQYRILKIVKQIPWLLRKIIIYLIKKKYPRIARLIECTRPLNMEELLQNMNQVYQNKTKQIFQVFSLNQLDAIIMPGFALPAPKTGDVGKISQNIAYTAGWNVLNYPVGLVPVSLVRQSQTDFCDTYNDIITKAMKENIKSSVGLPAGVQIVSTPFNEQKILYLMEQLNKVVKFRQKYKPSL